VEPAGNSEEPKIAEASKESATQEEKKVEDDDKQIEIERS
jgi:hypothetical protein